MTNQPSRKIESHVIHSIHLGEDRTVKVFVPPMQDASQRLPIVYCHDGIEFFTHGRIATIASTMIAAGEIPPFLIAGIAVNMEHRNADYAMDGVRHRSYLQFVADECMPFMEERYAISQGNRMMAGISLGAVATLSFALNFPDVFDRLVLFSGAYFPSVQERLRKERDLSRISAYMFIGDEEHESQTPSGIFDFLTYNETMRDILVDRGAAVEYEVGPGNHFWGVWQRQIPTALRWIGQHIRPSAD
ncbi:alpha/beta hydrolase [Alicyclobacillus acidiphilus]|uniref:alpha/beta hydrolase n=1 Tax=Alicyclobacillus acidiphilus TaxID=182455 RepID=UPI00082E0BC9|nr:alpha/beta hydrolase-fold protein [Alicyclobacillus acidiphilus]